MKKLATQKDEAARQQAVDETGLLDSGSEERFDRFTRMARRAFKVPIALITLVDRDRMWFKSSDGLSASETPRDISFCAHAISQSDLFIIEDALKDHRFSDNPLVTDSPFIRFYAGAPLHNQSGYRLGTLCLIDDQPRSLDPDQQTLLRDLADGVEQEINRQNIHDFYRELRQSERRTRAVIQGTRVGTWEWNVQTGETVFNERWAGICGYRLEELEPINIQTWLGLAHPDDLAESERRLNEHFAGNLPEYDFRCRMRHKDGHWVWVHDRGQVLEWTDQGEPLMMFGTHANVTDEMNNLAKIQRQNTALGILNNLALDSGADDEQLIRKALRLATDFLELPIGIISEINSNVYSVRWFLAPADSELRPDTTFRLQDTYCALLLRNKDSLAISHVGSSSFQHEHCYQVLGLESYLAAPIYVRHRLFGTLNFSSTEPRSEPFSDTEITFVTLLARWVSSILERQQSVQMLTKLVDQTPGVLYQFQRWPDGSSAFPFASPHIRDIYNVDPADVQSDASRAFHQICPEDLDDVANSIEESAQTLSIWKKQYRVKAGEKAWKWVEGTASPEKMPDSSVVWHGYIADIDDTKRTELALKESEAQLRRLFELSPIGIALSDYHSGQFLDVNESLLEPTGFSRSQLLSMSFGQFVALDAEEHRQKMIACLKQSGRFGPHEVAVHKADGTTFPAIMRGIKIRDYNGHSLVWTLVEDISERKKVDRMKNEFISTVSHELRTPLTSITGSLGLLASDSMGELPDEMSKMISIAHRNSKHLKHLVDDLLDMEKLVSGKMTMHLQPEPVLPLIRESVDSMATYATSRRITLDVSESATDYIVIVDRTRFNQALANLLSNAIKFSDDGGSVAVEIAPTAGHLRILVNDHGPGVPEAFRPQLFKKFAQADSSATRSRGGTGLGLAITKEIMAQMGGGVGLESTEGQGATFWLDLILVHGLENQ